MANYPSPTDRMSRRKVSWLGWKHRVHWAAIVAFLSGAWIALLPFTVVMNSPLEQYGLTPLLTQLYQLVFAVTRHFTAAPPDGVWVVGSGSAWDQTFTHVSLVVYALYAGLCLTGAILCLRHRATCALGLALGFTGLVVVPYIIAQFVFIQSDAVAGYGISLLAFGLMVALFFRKGWRPTTWGLFVGNAVNLLVNSLVIAILIYVKWSGL